MAQNNHRIIGEGEFERKGKTYKYFVKLPKDFDDKRKLRVQIMEEHPEIHKVRTRYDPEIEAYGDKNAAMKLRFGYSMKEINSSIRRFWVITSLLVLLPLCSIGSIWLFTTLKTMDTTAYQLPTVWFFGIIAVTTVSYFYYQTYKIWMQLFADYLKAKETKAMLEKGNNH